MEVCLEVVLEKQTLLKYFKSGRDLIQRISHTGGDGRSETQTE